MWNAEVGKKYRIFTIFFFSDVLSLRFFIISIVATNFKFPIPHSDFRIIS